MLRVTAHKPHHIPQVVAVHGDEIIVGLIVPPGHLPGGLACTADTMLSQFAPDRRIDRVVDFLGACGRRGDFKLPGKPAFSTKSFITNSAIGLRQILPWQMNNTLIIFLYLHLSLVFLLKRLIFQGFPTFEFSFLFKVSSQIFSYFLVFFPAILVNPLVKQTSLPTGFFNYSLSDILLPLHHQNSHGCKCSRLH